MPLARCFYKMQRKQTIIWSTPLYAGDWAGYLFQFWRCVSIDFSVPIHQPGEYMWGTFCQKLQMFIFMGVSTQTYFALSFHLSDIALLSDYLFKSRTYQLCVLYCAQSMVRIYERRQWEESLFQMLVFYSCGNMQHTMLLITLQNM